MKKVITFIAILCVIIIGFSILNNISFHKKVLSRKSTELLKDSLLLRQVEMQGLLLQKNRYWTRYAYTIKQVTLLYRKKYRK